MERTGFAGVLRQLDSLKWRVTLKGVVVGMLAGLLVVLYRLLIEAGTEQALKIYAAIRENPLWLLPWAVGAGIVGYLIYLLIRWEPYSKGSGIPQVEGIVLFGLKIRWWSVMVARFLAGALSSLFGVSLGREGPSIQIGAAGAQAVSRKICHSKLEENYLITAGASAGLSAAFSAPLSGIIFSLEEVHRSFSPNILIAATSAALTADMISKTVFGLKPVLSYTQLPQLPIGLYALLPLLGVLAGLVGALTNRSLLDVDKIYRRLPEKIRPILALGIALPCGLFLPQVLGGGQGLIKSVESADAAVPFLLLLMAVKLIFTSTSFGSGLPGGIFMPILTIGALMGGAFAHTATGFGVAELYVPTFCVCAMAGVMAACVKAPVTSILLMTEMTGSVVHLLPVATVAFVALLISDLLHISPIYEQLLERTLEARSNEKRDRKGKRTMIEVPVELGSLAAEQSIREIEWPEGALIVTVRRGGQDIVPKGNTMLCPGDFLLVMANDQRFEEMNQALGKICRAR